MKLFDEVTFWLFLALAITFFVIGFRGLLMIVLSKLPVNGVTSALAAGA